MTAVFRYQTEDQIERDVERKMDALDTRLLRGELSQPNYDFLVSQLDMWAKEELNKLKARGMQ